MPTQEKIIIAVSLLAIVAIVIWRNGAPWMDDTPTLEQSQDAQATLYKTGPGYLVANSPYLGNPAVGNVIPSRSMGMVGQQGQWGAFEDFTDCGCN